MTNQHSYDSIICEQFTSGTNSEKGRSAIAKTNEELLSAWLRISTSIVNSRIVSELSFNETLVCNVLYRNSTEQTGRKLTATELCNETKMLKSQMNRTLNMLKEKHMITRERSTADRRHVLISLNPEKLSPYEAQHQRILQLLDHIIAEVGDERINDIIKEALNKYGVQITQSDFSADCTNFTQAY